MPELPEVETMVRGIRPSVEGRTIVDVRRCRCPFRSILMQPGVRSMKARSVGRTIAEVRRLAKRVVLRLDTEDAFVIEPRMTGLMLLSGPPDRAHLRVQWTFAEHVGRSQHARRGSRLWFWDRRGLGTVRLHSPEEFERELGPHKLGPDTLLMTIEDWQARLARTRRPIKVALLDQKMVAGIGNLYASEILHAAGIHPEKTTDRLGRPQFERLAEATQTVLQTAIQYEGSTLGDGTYRNALNRNGRYQNEHRVYAREGERCSTCGKGCIRRIVQAQRSTFFCPRCQRR